MLQVKFHGRNMPVVWCNPELNVLLLKALLAETMSGQSHQIYWSCLPQNKAESPNPCMNSLLTQNASAPGLALLCWAAAGSHCRQSLGEHKTEAKRELLQCLAMDVPLLSLPTLHGTIQHCLPGPDSLFPDYLVVVVVGNEKKKMFVFPKQRGT